MSLFSGPKQPAPPKFLIDHPGKIVEAFEFEGVKYYCFEDIFSLPTIRGLQALDYYEEFNMRCTKEFLLKFTEAAETLLTPETGQRLNLPKLFTIVKYLRERLEGLPTVDHVYRLASVVFFDGSEDPFYWSREKAKAKIEAWKRNPEILSFFLRMPLKDLIPASKLPLLSSQTSIALASKIDQIHLKELGTILSVDVTKIDM